MDPALAQIINPLIGTIVGGVIVALANGRIKRRLDDLEDNRLARIEHTVDTHIGDDRSAVIETKLTGLCTQVDRMDGKIDVFTKGQARHEAEIKGTAKFLDNVNTSLQDHKQGPHNA
jgi:hypothetical protein